MFVPDGSKQIVIICPNATLDLIYTEPERQFYSKLFYKNLSVRAGGSGVNVASAMSHKRLY